MKALACGLFVALLLTWTLAARGPATVAEPPVVAVGTFDSRAVAVAWVRSASFRADLERQTAERERARKAGDQDRVAELDAYGRELQERLHQQGFGTAPAEEALAVVEDRLPAIAKAAGVEVIVSKWALAWSHPKASFTDVTDRLVEEFEPDAETKERIRELLATDPVPAEELRKHDH